MVDRIPTDIPAENLASTIAERRDRITGQLAQFDKTFSNIEENLHMAKEKELTAIVKSKIDSNDVNRFTVGDYKSRVFEETAVLLISNMIKESIGCALSDDSKDDEDILDVNLDRLQAIYPRLPPQDRKYGTEQEDLESWIQQRVHMFVVGNSAQNKWSTEITLANIAEKATRVLVDLTKRSEEVAMGLTKLQTDWERSYEDKGKEMPLEDLERCFLHQAKTNGVMSWAGRFKPNTLQYREVVKRPLDFKLSPAKLDSLLKDTQEWADTEAENARERTSSPSVYGNSKHSVDWHASIDLRRACRAERAKTFEPLVDRELHDTISSQASLPEEAWVETGDLLNSIYRPATGPPTNKTKTPSRSLEPGHTSIRYWGTNPGSTSAGEDPFVLSVEDINNEISKAKDASRQDGQL